MTVFEAHGRDVVMITDHGPVRLRPESIEQLLDIFEHEGAAEVFNALWQARADAVAALLTLRSQAEGTTMNIIETTARQGDVMLVRVDALPDGLIPTRRDKVGRIVLAHGERSGHGHAIRDPHVCGFRLATTGDDPTGVSGGVDYIEVGGSGPATLNHEYESGKMAEHEPIGLPPGVYKVALQREYSPKGIVRAQD